MPSHRTARRHSRFERRRLEWVEFDGAVVPTTNAHGANIDLLQPYRANGGITQSTTVMTIHLRLAPSTAVANHDTFKWGLLVVGLESIEPTAYSTGSIPGFPNPSDSPNQDWLMVARETALPTYGLDGTNQMLYHIKARRRIPELEQTLMLSAVSTTVGASLTIGVYARILLALP